MMSLEVCDAIFKYLQLAHMKGQTGEKSYNLAELKAK